ncbi:MAG: LptF/LptG family permease [Opitutales bacterium]|nr:LptF/LptG family permease [Opitutales bacterium]
MNRIQRYIFSSLAVTCTAGVGLFVFVLLTGNAMRDIVGLLADGRIPFLLFTQLLFLLVPYAVAFAMPLGVLIGILVLVGRMSANRELTALKASGVSLWSVSAPILLFSLIATVFTVWINISYAPSARASYRDILNDLVRNDPLRFIVPRTFIHDFPGYVLYVGEKDGIQMREFWLWELDEDRRAVNVLRAEEGSFRFDVERDALVLILRNGHVEMRDERNPDNLAEIRPSVSFRDTSVLLPLDRILGRAHRPLKTSWLNLERLLERREDLRAQLRAPPPEFDESQTRGDLAEVQFFISRNFAMGFSIFSLALLGIPLGIKASRTETYANLMIALLIALAYYLAITMIGWADRNPAARADIWVWAPNIACQVCGIALLLRASRH